MVTGIWTSSRPDETPGFRFFATTPATRTPGAGRGASTPCRPGRENHGDDRRDRQVATIQAGSGYVSSSPPIAAFGLGQDTQVDSIEVVFSDGMQASLASPEVHNVVSNWHPLLRP